MTVAGDKSTAEGCSSAAIAKKFNSAGLRKHETVKQSNFLGSQGANQEFLNNGDSSSGLQSLPKSAADIGKGGTAMWFLNRF